MGTPDLHKAQPPRGAGRGAGAGLRQRPRAGCFLSQPETLRRTRRRKT